MCHTGIPYDLNLFFFLCVGVDLHVACFLNTVLDQGKGGHAKPQS